MEVHLETHHTKQQIADACSSILQPLRPGDVINQANEFPWWAFHYNAAIKAIQIHQQRLFGMRSNWRDDHNMLYFDETNTFSVEPPRAIFKPLETYCMTNISIYRFRKRNLTARDLAFMRETGLSMVGEDYDVGQLIDRVINRVLGFQWEQKIRIFDAGIKKMVCSVGIRAVFENLYQKRLAPAGGKSELWLFNKMNPIKWPRSKLESFRGTDIDATTPAHFANSDRFENEFELIAKFNNGKRMYP